MISLESVTVRRGTRMLFEQATLAFHDVQHVGITGANGTGKSSLFQLLLGGLAPDLGNVRVPVGLRIAHMAQEVHYSPRSAVEFVIDGDRELRRFERELAAAEGRGDDDGITRAHAGLDHLQAYNARHRALQLLHGLGFSQADCTRPVTAFSGGWRIRLNLAQTLMAPGDLLLLDEPNNHLDLDATTWLEAWLKRYPGTLLLISHDRDFLDGVVTHIVHIEQQRLTAYRGNYSAFELQRAEKVAQQQALYEKQQRRVGEIEAFVRRFRAKASKARQAQSRLKELERMQTVAAAHFDSPFNFRILEADKQSDPLLSLQDVDVGYGDQVALSNLRITLHPGSRIGLLGANGAGKSTFIKALTGELPARRGRRTAGAHLAPGYFAQQQLEALDLEASAALHLQRLSPLASEQQIRNFLGGFAFHGDQALAPIKPFSGGEKARLALAIVCWQQPNLLLLDEPTNHLDLDMRHALTLALQEFTGAIVLVSHDRHLLRNCVDQFYLISDGQVAPFDGDLEDYHQLRARRDTGDEAPAAPSTRSAQSAREARQQAAARRAELAPMRQAVKRTESELEQLRQRLATLVALLADEALYASDQRARLQTLLKERGALEQNRSELEARWLEQQEALEILEQQEDLPA